MQTKSNDKKIISITELELKSIWGFPRFALYAFRTNTQAMKAHGKIKIKTSSKGWRFQYTMTLWVSRKDMINYKTTGAHKEAIKMFPKIARGKIFSYEGSELPDWDEAHRLLSEKGRVL